MDDLDRKILELLTRDARRSLADIGGVVGLSTSSVNERVRRLVQTGIIRRFTVDIDPLAAGLGTSVFVWVALREGADEVDFYTYLSGIRAVQECHHVTGAWSYLLKLRVSDTSQIEPFLADMKRRRFLGRSETVLSLSAPVAGVFVPREID